MEARSLADLNILAGNPPPYPENPTQEKQDPLTLYISRVPGTRDVILSTFKPQIKNVTAEDVNNSLYYIHLDIPLPGGPAPTDALDPPTSFLDDIGLGPRRQGSDSPPARDIPRKPLPATARPITPESPPNRTPRHASPRPAPPASRSSDWFAGIGIGDDELGLAPPKPPRPGMPDGDSGVALARHSFDSSQYYGPPAPPNPAVSRGQNAAQPPPAAPVPRKPLGPRPMVMESLAQDVNGSEPAPSLPPRPRAKTVGTRPPPNLASRSPSPRKAFPRTSSTPAAPSTPFTLHLIRRDPGTGSQWNVGRVSSRQLDITNNDDTATQDLASSARPAINIQIETPGYSRFRNMPVKGNIEAVQEALRNGTSGAAAISAAVSAAAAPAPEMRPSSSSSSSSEHQRRPSAAEQAVFSRQVVMGYSKSWRANLKERLQAMDKNGWSLKYHNQQSRNHPNRSSADAIDTTNGNAHNHHTHSQQHPSSSANNLLDTSEHPAPGMKPRGYVFTTPWDGRCEFRTGTGGRSVRCNRLPSEAQQQAYNPLVSQPGMGPGGISNPLSAPVVPISELRFNLPNSELFGGGGNGSGGGGGGQGDNRISGVWADTDRGDLFSREHWRGNFNKLIHPRSAENDAAAGDYDDDNDEYGGSGGVSPLDLHLGREKAGGGNRGKRAKLGKLIIYDEGLKMLDLVVAANIGVWWGAWERSF